MKKAKSTVKVKSNNTTYTYLNDRSSPYAEVGLDAKKAVGASYKLKTVRKSSKTKYGIR